MVAYVSTCRPVLHIVLKHPVSVLVFLGIYNKLRQIDMESVLFAKKNTSKVMSLSPTTANLFQHVFHVSSTGHAIESGKLSTL